MQAGCVCAGSWGAGVAGTRVIGSMCVPRHACVCARTCGCAQERVHQWGNRYRETCVYIYVCVHVRAFLSRCCTPVRLQHPFAAAFLSMCSLMSWHSRVN